MSFATLRKTVCTDIDIGTALKEITSNPHIGDALAFDLLDGRHIECAVTDIDDKAIRFDSVDCLGDDMTYGKVEKWLDRIDHLMPDELREAIVDTERKHTIVITLEGRGVNTSVLIGSVLAELGYEENGNE